MHTAYKNQKSVAWGTKAEAFTIVELLIIIIVLAILGLIVINTVNPGEIMKQSRDAMRVSDLQALNKVLLLYEAEGNTSFGTANTVYLSLPDSNANCSTYALPTLPGGWSYACKPEATYKNVDGTGWVPVDFSNILSGSPMSNLPVDPVNSITGRYYYSYITGGSWELNASVEAQANVVGNSGDKVSSDGGDDPTKLEIGTNLALAPWSFEFSAFPVVANNSGFPGWFKNGGTGSASATSDFLTPNFIRATGYVWYNWQENVPFNPDSTYKMTCRVRQVTDPTVGGKSIYCGWTGVAADGVTLVNTTGANTYSSQHYQVMSGISLTAGADWSTYTGYTKGWGSPNGNSGNSCWNSSTPCKMHQDVRYIRPLFIANYSGGNGLADIDSIIFTKQ